MFARFHEYRLYSIRATLGKGVIITLFGQKMKLVQPLKERESFFNGWEPDKATYKFECPHCGSKLTIKFKQMLDAAWGWQERMPNEMRNALALIFKIDLNDRNIRNGMNAVVETECAKCKRATFTFFWFDEYRHSCYDISLRASAIQETEQIMDVNRP